MRDWFVLAGVLAILASCSRAAPVPSESHVGHQTPAPVASGGAASDAARINTTPAPGPPPKGMVWIPGGTFWMGCEGCGMPDAVPAHLVEVDGFWMDRAPVTAFPPNGFGLYDTGGNVWQWCADWYRPDYFAVLAKVGTVARNPPGPGDSFDPQEPGAAKRVLKGGSYLCTDQYCARYLVGSRGKSEVSSGASNLGFRLVRSGGTDGRGGAHARSAGAPP